MMRVIRIIRIRSIIATLATLTLLAALVMVTRSYLFKEAFGFQQWTLQAEAKAGSCVLRREIIGVFWSEGRIAFGSQNSNVSDVLHSQAQKHGLRAPAGWSFGLITLYDGEHSLLGRNPLDGNIAPLGLHWGSGGYA